MEFSRQHHWSRLPFPSPGDLADPRIKFVSPALADGVFTTEPHNETWLPLYVTHKVQEVYGYNLQFVLKPCLFGSLINSSYLSWAYHLPLAKPAEKFTDCFVNGPEILQIFLCSWGVWLHAWDVAGLRAATTGSVPNSSKGGTVKIQAAVHN